MSWLKDLRTTIPVEEPVALWHDVLMGLTLSAEQQVQPPACRVARS